MDGDHFGKESNGTPNGVGQSAELTAYVMLAAHFELCSSGATIAVTGGKPIL